MDVTVVEKWQGRSKFTKRYHKQEMETRYSVRIYNCLRSTSSIASDVKTLHLQITSEDYLSITKERNIPKSAI